MIVAGLLLTRMTSRPSARSAFHACVHEESNSQAWPMTIGPEPITSTRLMSVRLGITLAFPSRQETAGTDNRHRVGPEPPPGGTARRTQAWSDDEALRPSHRRD